MPFEENGDLFSRLRNYFSNVAQQPEEEYSQGIRDVLSRLRASEEHTFQEDEKRITNPFAWS